ncbi:hypothetical protein UA38_20470 [Photobacterium kishitanii]|nr:hypothetical protein [Photobacterium kishitanii]KJG55308.1 hypothetical protein UA38_20470 [Photobacterium kishitanii]KJG58422.1 hypothetical protein UA42_19875 [Photobacterium kishitanii]
MLTLPILYCIFNGNVPMTHFMYEDKENRASTLPNLYIVFMCKRNNEGMKIIKIGLIVKTILSLHDENLILEINKICLTNQALTSIVNDKNITFSLKKIAIEGITNLTEYEYLQIIAQQYLYITSQQYFKHS